MKFLLLNGPNLNMLGTREPDIYGRETLADVEAACARRCAELGVEMDSFQSNHEGALIDAIQQAMGAYDAIVYNPGAHTHYSYAIHDAITSVDVPVVEVHISDISAREDFRKTSVLADACIAQVAGQGTGSYLRGIEIAKGHIDGLR